MQDKIGFITFSEEIAERPVSRVRDAARVAGFADFVRDLSDRSCFIRATHRLLASGVIEAPPGGVLRDKITDDEREVAFQFSKRHLESNGVSYENAAVIRFDKKDGLIACEVQAVKELAVKLLDAVRGMFSVTDINSLVKRVYASECKRVPIRDAVYFVPAQRQELVKRLGQFYSELGFSYVTLPVGQSDKQGGALLKAVLKDMREQIKQVETEIAGLKGGDKLTSRIAKNRIQDLKRELAQYREVAESLQVDMQDLLSQAGESAQALVQAAMPVDSLIAAVQQGGKLNPLVLELLSADEDNKQAVEALNTAVALQEVDLPSHVTSVAEDLDAAKLDDVQLADVDLVGGKKGGRK